MLKTLKLLGGLFMKLNKHHYKHQWWLALTAFMYLGNGYANEQQMQMNSIFKQDSQIIPSSLMSDQKINTPKQRDVKKQPPAFSADSITATQQAKEFVGVVHQIMPNWHLNYHDVTQSADGTLALGQVDMTKQQDDDPILTAGTIKSKGIDFVHQTVDSEIQVAFRDVKIPACQKGLMQLCQDVIYHLNLTYHVASGKLEVDLQADNSDRKIGNAQIVLANVDWPVEQWVKQHLPSTVKQQDQVDFSSWAQKQFVDALKQAHVKDFGLQGQLSDPFDLLRSRWSWVPELHPQVTFHATHDADKQTLSFDIQTQQDSHFAIESHYKLVNINFDSVALSQLISQWRDVLGSTQIAQSKYTVDVQTKLSVSEINGMFPEAKPVIQALAENNSQTKSTSKSSDQTQYYQWTLQGKGGVDSQLDNKSVANWTLAMEDLGKVDFDSEAVLGKDALPFVLLQPETKQPALKIQQNQDQKIEFKKLDFQIDNQALVEFVMTIAADMVGSDSSKTLTEKVQGHLNQWVDESGRSTVWGEIYHGIAKFLDQPDQLTIQITPQDNQDIDQAAFYQALLNPPVQQGQDAPLHLKLNVNGNEIQGRHSGASEENQDSQHHKE